MSDTAPKASPPARKSPTRLSQFWVIGISTLVLGLIGFLIIRVAGYVEGVEFSPTHFQSRRFTFYEIPVLHWQITPIDRESTTPDTAISLTQKKLITPPAGAPTIWHLVSLKRGSTPAVNDDAALLMQQLRFVADGDVVWRKWSNDHPELAKILWPTIAKLSERELYVLMPRLFEMVRQIKDPAAFQTLISGYLQTEYASLIRDMRDAGQDELADSLAQEADAGLVER